MKIISTVPASRFEKYGVAWPENWEVKYLKFPYTDEEMIDAAKDADVIFVDSIHPITKTIIDGCKNLRMLHTEGVSYDKIDMQAAKEAGVPVCNNRAVNAAAVAEHCIGLMLAGLRHTARSDYKIKNVGYIDAKAQTTAEGIRELGGQEIGLIGMGVIGKEVAKRLMPWGCKLRYYDVVRMNEETEQEYQMEYLPFDELLSNSDIISIHVPVTKGTLRMIGADQLKLMKSNALLINNSRGEIVDNMALAEALEKGRIFGAALDTVDPEPLPEWHPLLHLSPEAEERLTLTPHIAGMTDGAFRRMLEWTIQDIQTLEQGGRPANVVPC